MKKLILCLFILFLVSGCKSNIELSKENFNQNIKKSCSTYETKLSNYFGGGEGQPHGYIEIGYCDNKLIRAYTESKESSIFSREFNFIIENFELSAKSNSVSIFGENLFSEEIRDNKIFLDLVIRQYELSDIITKIEKNILPLLNGKYKLGYINFFITDESNLQSENLKISYLINKDKKFGCPNMCDEELNKYYNKLNFLDMISEDTIEGIEQELIELRNKI